MTITGRTGSYFTLLLQEQEVTWPCFNSNSKVLYPASIGTGSYFTLLVQKQEGTLPCFYRNRMLLYPASTGTGSYFTLLVQKQDVILPCYWRPVKRVYMGQHPAAGMLQVEPRCIYVLTVSIWSLQRLCLQMNGDHRGVRGGCCRGAHRWETPCW